MSLTGGFDLQIAIPESIVDRFVGAYWTWLSMPRVIRSIGTPGDPDGIVSLNLDAYPDVHLNPHDNVVELRIGFSAGIIGAYHYDEGYGIVSVPMSISRQSVITDGTQQVTISILPTLDAQGHPILSFKSVHSLSNATLKDIIKPVLAAKFAEIGLQSQLLPSLTLPSDTFLDTKIYSEYEVGSFLSIFANQNGGEAALPSTGWCLTDTELSLCIDGSVVQDRINEKLKEMSLAPSDLPAEIPGHPDTTLHEIDFTLMHNYIAVTGVMEHDGIEASFSTKLALACSGNSLTVEAVYDTSVDLPWYVDFVDFFVRRIEDAAEDAVDGAVGGLSTSALGDALPWTDVPNVPDEILLQVNYDGEVYEDTSGLALQGEASIIGASSKSYYVGHRLTREVHTPQCQYGAKLYWGPRPSYSPAEEFDSVDDALACGYNGCAFCLPQENVEPAAIIDVRVKMDLDADIPPPDHNWASEIAIGMYRLENDANPRPVILDAPLVYHKGLIRFGRNRAGYYDSDGDVIPDIMPIHVTPGKWRIFAKRGSWFEKADVDANAVPPKTSDNIVYAYFRYGAGGASVKVGSEPSFP